jgi:hypothetical protein
LAPISRLVSYNLDDVTRSIVDGLKANVAIVSLSNLDAAIALLYELGKQREAKNIFEFFVAKKPTEFWTSVDPFRRGPFHPAVAKIVNAQRTTAAAATTFDPEVELIQAAQSYNNEAINKLANVPVDEYYRMIKTKDGRSALKAATRDEKLLKR